MNGKDPYVMIGFKPGIDRETFKQAVLAQDIPQMMSMLHRIKVKPGDNFFIPGRLPHAIGSGVLMLEVQEPTDLVVQPERKIGDITLSDFDMWQNLTMEQGLDCFEYRGRTLEEVLQEFSIHPVKKNGPVEILVDSEYTDCFQVMVMKLFPGEKYDYHLSSQWQLAVVTSGGGNIETASRQMIHHGDCFLIPNPVRNLTFVAGEKGLVIYLMGKGC